MITILVILVVAGVLLYLLNTLVPMDGRIKTAINAIVLLFIFLFILDVLGIWDGGRFLRT